LKLPKWEWKHLEGEFKTDGVNYYALRLRPPKTIKEPNIRAIFIGGRIIMKTKKKNSQERNRDFNLLGIRQDVQ